MLLNVTLYIFCLSVYQAVYPSFIKILNYNYTISPLTICFSTMCILLTHIIIFVSVTNLAIRL